MYAACNGSNCFHRTEASTRPRPMAAKQAASRAALLAALPASLRDGDGATAEPKPEHKVRVDQVKVQEAPNVKVQEAPTETQSGWLQLPDGSRRWASIESDCLLLSSGKPRWELVRTLPLHDLQQVHVGRLQSTDATVVLQTKKKEFVRMVAGSASEANTWVARITRILRVGKGGSAGATASRASRPSSARQNSSASGKTGSKTPLLSGTMYVESAYAAGGKPRQIVLTPTELLFYRLRHEGRPRAAFLRCIKTHLAVEYGDVTTVAALLPEVRGSSQATPSTKVHASRDITCISFPTHPASCCTAAPARWCR